MGVTTREDGLRLQDKPGALLPKLRGRGTGGEGGGRAGGSVEEKKHGSFIRGCESCKVVGSISCTGLPAAANPPPLPPAHPLALIMPASCASLSCSGLWSRSNPTCSKGGGGGGKQSVGNLSLT